MALKPQITRIFILLELVWKPFFVSKFRDFRRAEDGRRRRIWRIYAKEDGRRRSRNPAIAVERRVFRQALTLSVFLLLVIAAPYPVSAQSPNESSSNKKAEIERQLGQLEQEAAGLDRQLQGVRGETQTLANEMKVIETEVKRRELEIKRLTLAARKASLEIEKKNNDVAALSKKIDSARRSLATGLFFLYLYDDENTLSALLKNRSLSSFFTTIENLTKIQETIRTTLVDFREDRTMLEKEKITLQQFREEQQELLALQEVERRFLDQKKKEKDELLRLTKGKEYLFQQLLQAKQKNIATLRTQLFYLEKTGITAEDAIQFAELAANRAGIRPAFLLALLEVETGKQFEEGVISVGSNVGKGNWKNDMYLCYQRLAKYYGNNNYNRRAEREKAAFFEITEKLGLEPDKMPVSKEPPYVGCGGAMGPAQFIPTTWLMFEDKVTALTGHNPPSPWNVEDAFTAAAIFLADAGADSKTATGETRAAKTYLSGSPTCSRYVCNSYASRILSLARDIDRIL